MKKTFLSSLLLSTMLSADTFEVFLSHALQNSHTLKASKLEIAISQEESEKLLRYENPTVGVDYAHFDPNNANADDGYSINLSQPLRLWGVGDDKESLATLMQEGAKLSYFNEKSLFIKNLSLHFVQYAKEQKLLALSREEQSLADKIYAISAGRYKAGSIAQKEFLQAKVAMQKQSIQTQERSLKASQAYYALLAAAGESEEPSISEEHHFTLQSKPSKNPALIRVKNAQNKAQARADIAQHKVTQVRVGASYEKEYEQDISSIGLSLPLAIFNSKSQERQIAYLKVQQLAQQKAQVVKNLALSLKKRKQEREQLRTFKAENARILETEGRLLTMFEEGYRISKSNLLELQNAKNALIKTKKRLIQLDATLAQNIIITNYIQGSFHD